MGRRLKPPTNSVTRRGATAALAVALLALTTLLGANAAVKFSAAPHVYADVQRVPPQRVGLLLGTSKYTVGGKINLFYKYRLDAAEALYKAGKVRYLILSGDNSSAYYDEPSTMRADLLARGVPAEHLRRDYAGFRTLDSVVRAQKVFGQTSFTVISQRFHNERAIFLARAKGLNVIGFDAREVGGAGGLRVQLREYLARVSAVLDVLSGKQPRFLGKPELIGRAKGAAATPPATN